jgi:surface polysaccharide O-acyltransferase-like enzyme
MVIISHSCDAFVGSFDNSFSFHTGVFWGSLVRACVPLFAMMSGILLFPVTTDLSTFYKKRIGRIVIPLIFGLLYCLCCFSVSELYKVTVSN